MPKTILLLFICVCVSSPLFGQLSQTEIMILGSDHLNQLYKKDNPKTDVLQPARQQELAAFTKTLEPYKPDMLLIESLPENQPVIDSLYNLYLADKLSIPSLENGRSEIFQIAFPLARRMHLKRIYCVDSEGGTSQSILDNGDHISIYREENAALKKFAGEKYKALQEGKLSLKEYLLWLNQPETYRKVYHLRYITPAKVTNGTFTNPDARIDTAFISKKHIGAELISVFKNRDYKIYSNIVTTQLSQPSKRLLLLIGVAHIGSLRSIIRDDSDFRLVDPVPFLKK